MSDNHSEHEGVYYDEFDDSASMSTSVSGGYGPNGRMKRQPFPQRMNAPTDKMLASQQSRAFMNGRTRPDPTSSLEEDMRIIQSYNSYSDTTLNDDELFSMKRENE